MTMAPGERRDETLVINWNPGINSGTFDLYIAGTATDYSGNQSVYSNEVVVTFTIEDVTSPAAPVLNGLDIVVRDNNGRTWRPIALRNKGFQGQLKTKRYFGGRRLFN
jgi:hypothetical protein